MSGSGDLVAGSGAGPWAICDRCGRKRRRATLRREWTQLLVCGECFDPRPAHLDPPRVDAREGLPIRDPRPVGDPVYIIDGSPVTLNGSWSAPAPTAQDPVVWISDDDPVTADDL